MNRPVDVAIVVGGGLMTLATVAPWATSKGTFSQSGLDRGDGAITGLIGAGVVVLGAITLGRRGGHRIRGATILLATSGLVIGIAENEKVSSAIAPVSATAHIGIYLLVVGSALALVAAWPRRPSDGVPIGESTTG
jgi:hypothetical protein